MLSSMEANTHTPNDLPIACSLNADALEARRRRWHSLGSRALIDQHATESGVRQRYRPDPDVERELRELVALEGDCCGFARWEVHAADGSLELEVSADGEGAAALHEMFGLAPAAT